MPLTSHAEGALTLCAQSGIGTDAVRVLGVATIAVASGTDGAIHAFASSKLHRGYEEDEGEANVPHGTALQAGRKCA